MRLISHLYAMNVDDRHNCAPSQLPPSLTKYLPDGPRNCLQDDNGFVERAGPRYRLLASLVRNAHSMVSIRFDLPRAATMFEARPTGFSQSPAAECDRCWAA